ncbi:hypothetical protein DFP72DRAFT_1070687 [Ephemerocybe angulata]|uniref:Nudix hydrolase domain-containing protein n=1 Tax=Ephemerocybe angulata TaxID=980116 RepID=A0A8H6M4L1_9AGAR|nr:hypothetical protein DFP72DRAFT_1070687 [Tulosesus angulatus]
MMFAACPILQQWNHEAAFHSRPAVLGGWLIALVACAIEGVEVVIGVGFPDGEGQRDGAGSAREVLEETGYKLAGRINPEHYIEMTNNEQRLNEKPISPSPPRFSRAPTMSLSASRSGYESPHVRELSCELADSIEMFVQMVLQISPAQVLDPGKEQFTACALSIPMSSMSAMFTVMKNINYLSTKHLGNMTSRSFGEDVFGTRLPGTPDGSLPPRPISPGVEQIVFDIGETLQAVGDALSGCAAQAGCCTTGM